MDELLGDWRVQLQTLGAVAWAMLLGGAIGFERELKRRPAGFRTHMLVAGAAALLVGLVDLIVAQHGMRADDGFVRIDPVRSVEAVIAAVGFIGAGTIFRARGDDGAVSGITTAASLLMAAVIGIAAGLGAHMLAFGATALALVVLVTLSWIERRHGPRPR